MRTTRRWVYLFLVLALFGCREKQQNAPSNATANLSSDLAKLAEQFEADSAKVRLVLLLSPS